MRCVLTILLRCVLTMSLRCVLTALRALRAYCTRCMLLCAQAGVVAVFELDGVKRNTVGRPIKAANSDKKGKKKN
jgi:hypothetical protein